MNISEEYLPIEGAGREELKTFYSWSTEDAIKAQDEWEKEEKQPAARGPLFRWIAAQELKELADEFISARDNKIILEAAFLCSMNDLPMPRWCSMAFIKAYRDVWFRAVTSWDEAFGKPHPKGTHARDYRTERNNALKVYLRIQEIKKNEPATPIDNFMFERVGKEFKVAIGKTKVAEWYYKVKRQEESREKMRNLRIREMEQNFRKGQLPEIE